jgi:hypothetical protein
MSGQHKFTPGTSSSMSMSASQRWPHDETPFFCARH